MLVMMLSGDQLYEADGGGYVCQQDLHQDLVHGAVRIYGSTKVEQTTQRSVCIYLCLSFFGSYFLSPQLYLLKKSLSDLPPMHLC